MEDYAVGLVGVDEFLARLGASPAMIDAANQVAMRDATLIGEAAAKREVPRRTGRLFSSITSEIVGAGPELVGRIGPNTEYAPFVEFGTGLYGPKHERIDPGKVMAWPGGSGARLSGRGGDMIFARSTAGMQPHPYMKPAADVVRAEGPGVFKAEAESIAHTLAGH